MEEERETSIEQSDTYEPSQSSSSILEYVYDDEILPEIEIREVVSIDEFIKNNPKFVAIDDEHLQIFFKQLFQKSSTANGFYHLHKEIIEDKAVDILNNIFVHVDAIRKDTEDTEAYLEARDKALQAPTFELRRIELNKLEYPFDPEPIIQEKQYLIDEPSNIVISQDPIDISKTLISDSVAETSLPVLGAYWKTPGLNKLIYIYETSPKSAPFKYVPWKATSNIQPNSIDISFDSWLRKNVQPTFKKTLENIQAIDSLHSYTVSLIENGYDISNLSINQDKLLRKYLQNLENIKEEDDKAHSQKYPEVTSIYPLLTYLESIKRHHERYTAYFKDERTYRIQEALGSYIASLPNFQNEIDTTDPYELFQQVIQGTRTLEELKALITQLNIRENFNRANTLLKSLSASKTYYDIDTMITFYKEIQKSIIDDVQTPFVSLYNDIAEVKQGNDTSKYDGTPMTKADMIFEESAYEVVTPIEEDDVTPEEEVYDSIPNSVFEKAFPEVSLVHEGIRDVIFYILPFLIKIRDASGLPWDINSWIKLYSIETQRKSRAQLIKDAIPDINDFIVNRICVNTLDISMQLISDLNTAAVAEKLKAIYPQIFIKWQEDCKAALLNSLTVWLLDVLESSLNGTLDFSTFNGMIEFADVWSPYGAPLIEKKSNKAAINYISEVSATLLPYSNIQARALEERILIIAKEMYSERVSKLQIKYKEVEEKKSKADKAIDELRQMLSDYLAITHDKSQFLKKRASTYVKAYFYLPTLMPKDDKDVFRKQPLWAKGCCLAKLDKDYEADRDLREHKNLNTLLKLKIKLAEDRWLTSEREILTLPRKLIDIKEKAAPKFEKLPSCFINESEILQEPIEFTQNDIWLQKSHYDILQQNAREGSERLIAQCIRFAYQNQKVKAEQILKIFGTLTQLSYVNHILLKIIQSTYLKLQSVQPESTEQEILQGSLDILYDMKKILHKFTKATGTEYTASIYRAKYILARAICLPGIPQSTRMVVPDNVTANFYSNILADNYTILSKWSTSNSMLTETEIRAYITKMREEQKKDTLKHRDTLNIDDQQLMKDMKRFGLSKILEKQQVNEATLPEEEIVAENIPDEDQEGESEWLQDPTDAEVIDEDILG
jgi:hypothetical protein